MTTDQYVQYIMRRLEEVSKNQPNNRSQHLYEQGLLISILASLAYRDSQNFDLIRKQFDKLTK